MRAHFQRALPMLGSSWRVRWGLRWQFHVVDPAVVAYAPEGGIPASELVILAQQDGKRLLAAFGQRAGLQPAPLEFIHVGKTATEIVKAAKDWPHFGL